MTWNTLLCIECYTECQLWTFTETITAALLKSIRKLPQPLCWNGGKINKQVMATVGKVCFCCLHNILLPLSCHKHKYTIYMVYLHIWQTYNELHIPHCAANGIKLRLCTNSRLQIKWKWLSEIYIILYMLCCAAKTFEVYLWSVVLHFVTMWPWPNINWRVRTRGGLSFGKFVDCSFSRFGFYLAYRDTHKIRHTNTHLYVCFVLNVDVAGWYQIIIHSPVCRLYSWYM